MRLIWRGVWALAVAGALALALLSARLYEDLHTSYTELARTQAELIDRERLAALGELSASIAHEVRNPLGVIFNSVGTLRRLLRPEGDVALLDYSVSRGPELSNPMDPSSEPTGNTTFVIDERYASPAGIARHWQDTTDNWPEMSSAAPAWFAKATIVTLHNGTVVQAL